MIQLAFGDACPVRNRPKIFFTTIGKQPSSANAMVNWVIWEAENTADTPSVWSVFRSGMEEPAYTCLLYTSDAADE